jgi:dimethylargininase
LREASIPIIARVEAPGILDGGDIAFAGETVFIGVPDGAPAFTLHSNTLGREQFARIAAAAGRNVVEVRYSGRFPRLASVFTPVAADTVIVASGVVDVDALERFTRIETAGGEELAAGVLVLGERRVLANVRFRVSLPMLRRAKLAVDAIDLWEFGKTGIVPSLLALPLQRA